MNRGLGLAEVVLAIALISITSVPVFYLFSTSRKMQGSAKYMALAISEANSMHAALVTAGKTKGFPLLATMTGDAELPPGFSLADLRLEPLKPPLHRQVSLAPTPETSAMLKVEIEVGWEPNNLETARYRLMGFIRGQ
jgi:hypothetical protein